jgi:hypothetical protein
MGYRAHLKPIGAGPIKTIQDAGFSRNSSNQRVFGFFMVRFTSF